MNVTKTLSNVADISWYVLSFSAVGLTTGVVIGKVVSKVATVLPPVIGVPLSVATYFLLMNASTGIGFVAADALYKAPQQAAHAVRARLTGVQPA